MSKGIQLWTGDRMRTYFRRIILREAALDVAGAEKLADALAKATNMLRAVEMPDEPAAAPATVAPKASAKTAAEKNKSADPKAPKPAVTPTPAASPPAFDPYAFSAMVVLTKQGRDGLAKKLAEIKSVEHLKKFADAQHLGFDRSLTKLEDVRKALLAAAEQRLADRRAAAS